MTFVIDSKLDLEDFTEQVQSGEIPWNELLTEDTEIEVEEL